VQTQASAAARKIIRKRAVEEQTGLSGTTIWREEKAGRFPVRIQITANSVGWYQDEITAWVHERIRGSKLPSPNPRAPHGQPTAKAAPPRPIKRPLGNSRPRQQTYSTRASR
jgi:prophage regulatory protein